MSESTNQTTKDSGIDEDVASKLNVNVDAAMSTSEVEDEFISPRTRILEAKSSEEEMTVTQTKVKSRHKWIEETLLKDQKPLSEKTRKLISRHSLPANLSAPLAKPTRTSLDGQDARAAIEGRQHSRDAAKARVHADLAEIGVGASSSSIPEDDSLIVGNETMEDVGDNSSALKVENQAVPTTSTEELMEGITTKAEILSPPADNSEVRMKPTNDCTENDKEKEPVKNANESSSAKTDAARAKAEEMRAKAKERLNATMALLHGNSANTTSASNGRMTASSPGKKANTQQAKSTSESNQKQVAANEPAEILGERQILQKNGGDAKRLAEVQASAEKLMQEQLAAEAAKQAELEKRIEQEKLMAKQRQRDEEEAHRLEQAKAERLEEERLAAEAAAELERLDQVQRYIDCVCEEEQNKRASNMTVPSIDNDDEASHQSMRYDPIVNLSSSYGSNAAPIMTEPSGGSSASSSMGQVDKMLFQGKRKDVEEDDSDEDYGAISSDVNESGSLLDVPDVSDNAEMIDASFSPGPMWRKAEEEAARAACSSRLANDLTPRDAPAGDGLESTPFMKPDQTSATRSEKSLPDDPAYDYHREEDREDVWVQESESVEQDVTSEWKGFKRQRMVYMVAMATVLGFFLSLYVQTTCHFVTANETVGEDEAKFFLYYGLHKFTPVDSAFLGHSYCLGYDTKYSYPPPMAPRIFGIFGTLFGLIPMIVICVYLRYTYTNEKLWNGAMWMLYLGFVCQIFTLSIFLLGMCQDGVKCRMGPGAWATGVVAIVWFSLSVEMKLNSPLIQPIESNDGTLVIEKDNYIVSLVKKLWGRINDTINGETKRKGPSLSRTAMKKQKGRVRKGNKETYTPPEIV